MSKRLARLYIPNKDAPKFVAIEEDGSFCEVLDLFSPNSRMRRTVVDVKDAVLLPPIHQTPSKIIAVGLNYQSHIEEMNHENISDEPVIFLKSPSSLLAPFQQITALKEWGRIDYEGELALIMGKSCKDVREENALDYLLGYTLANDVTARDLQRKDNQWGRAKNFDTFCPLGPYLLVNEGQDPGDFWIETQLDGKTVQKAKVSTMRFSVPFIISYISHVMTLYPGDVILTGTPAGVGPLKDGQTVSIGIDEIGWLENQFKLESIKSTYKSLAFADP